MLAQVLAIVWKYKTLVLLALLVLATVLTLRATAYGAKEHARAEQALRDHKAELARALGTMEARNADLHVQLELLRKELGKIEPVSVAHAETPAKPANPHAAPIPRSPSSCPGAPPAPACLFDSSSKARLVLDSAEVVSSRGDRWNVLGISAQRTSPLPETVLFSDGLAIPLAPVNVLTCPECRNIAPSRLVLSLRAEWDPGDLQARPALQGELAYRLLSLWRFDLSPYASVEEHYGAWNGRGGVKLDVNLY